MNDNEIPKKNPNFRAGLTDTAIIMSSVTLLSNEETIEHDSL